jgi:hypothetical protein
VTPNKRIDSYPERGVYLERPGKWGHPFWLNKDGLNRAGVIAKYDSFNVLEQTK